MDRWLKEYRKKFKGADGIPTMELMGNEVFEKQFDNDPEKVYLYCVENNVRWEDVLGYEFDPNVLY